MIMVATTNGNGPYLPVIVLKSGRDRRVVIGRDPFEDMGEALLKAQTVLEAIRDQDRAKGFDDILASLP